jgi:glycosyltransferase involved in cell wall biosynthesis
MLYLHLVKGKEENLFQKYMYNQKIVSVVMATYREKNSIRKVTEDFLKTGFVDEVIIVTNNAEKGTNEEVKKTKAILLEEKRQGYGFAFQTGISSAKGDFIILCEPDGTYLASDIEKFLLYAHEGFDVVFGSRTGQNTLLSGADMTVWRKWANVLEAKSIEVLFNTNALSDVGCTYKLLTKSSVQKLKKLWEKTDSLFATEVLLLTVSHNLKYIEIPIQFKKRVGTSSLTDTWQQLMKWGIYIQTYIFLFWLKWMFRKNSTSKKTQGFYSVIA